MRAKAVQKGEGDRAAEKNIMSLKNINGDGAVVAIVVVIGVTIAVGYICGTIEEVARIKQSPTHITNIYDTNTVITYKTNWVRER